MKKAPTMIASTQTEDPASMDPTDGALLAALLEALQAAADGIRALYGAIQSQVGPNDVTVQRIIRENLRQADTLLAQLEDSPRREAVRRLTGNTEGR